MAIDISDGTSVGQLGYATAQLKQRIDETFKAGTVTNNTVALFTSSDTTGTAAFSFNLPTVVQTASGVEFRNGNNLIYKIPIMQESD